MNYTTSDNYVQWASSKSNYDAVVLAAGDFPVHTIPLGILHSAKKLICCDSAGWVAIKKGLHPEARIGDGDSFPQELKTKYANKFHQIEEQDYNDLTKATRYAKTLLKEKEMPRIAYIGATGKREDHTIANISLLLFFKNELGINPTMLTDYGRFTPCEGLTTFESFPGQQVSIFNIGNKMLEQEGLKWDTRPFTELWQGTLNEATGSAFTIKGDGKYLVYQTYEKKSASF